VRLTFVTLFCDLIAPYFERSILKRAIDRELLSIECVNPRDFTADKHQKTDDTATSGGAGMVMTPQPLFDCLIDIKRRSQDARVLFMTPCAKRFNSHDAKRLAGFEHIVLVCGRYEGFDERVIETFAHEVLSIGDFVLTGGELAALAVADSLLRFVPNVLGNRQSLDEESFEHALLEAPAFTKPAIFRGQSTPQTLLSGDHKAIARFKDRLAALKTAFFRPDML
jgi:tRNA (guanine37-N1)-methyltransferase